VRLSLDDYVFLSESVKITPDGGSPDTNTHTAFGLVPSALGLGAGYGIGSSVLIGGKLQFFQDQSDLSDTSSTSLLPFVELSLGTGEVQPMLVLLTGFRSQTVEQDGGPKTQSRAFAIGGGAGVRLFPSRDFSIDPFVQAIFQSGSGEVGDQSAKFQTTSLLVGFSISGWIGQSRRGEADIGTSDELERTHPEDDPDRPVAEPSEAPPTEDVDVAAGPAPKVGQDGTVDIRFPLSGGAWLRLVGKPAENPVAAAVEVTFMERGERFAKCGELALETGEATTPLDGVEPAVAADQKAFMLRGRLKVSTLSAFGAASHSALVVCDDSFELAAKQRRFVQRFLEVFQAETSRD
jgi:hypothetical protein